MKGLLIKYGKYANRQSSVHNDTKTYQLYIYVDVVSNIESVGIYKDVNIEKILEMNISSVRIEYLCYLRDALNTRFTLTSTMQQNLDILAEV